MFKKFFKDKLEQDIGSGDITTNSLISKNKNIKAYVIVKEQGILAGMEEVSLLINKFKIKKFKKDGDKIKIMIKYLKFMSHKYLKSKIDSLSKNNASSVPIFPHPIIPTFTLSPMTYQIL